MLLVASALLGAADAAIDVSWPLLIADHAARDEQAAAAAGLGAIMGLRGLLDALRHRGCPSSSACST